MSCFSVAHFCHVDLDWNAKKRVHTLRHTFASQISMSGVSLSTVMKLMGHTSLEMLKRRYGHLEDEYKRPDGGEAPDPSDGHQPGTKGGTKRVSKNKLST